MSRARLFDTVLYDTGRPVVGASVAVYQPNTTTPISETLYADDIGGTTLTNPLATGADGSFLAYLDVPRRVDLFISAVGITSRTVPDVGVFPDPADFTTDTDLGNHVGAADPHTGYVLDADLSAHAGAADPHTVYQKESEKGANNGYAGLGAGGLVPVAQLATGTPDGTKFVRDDGTLVLPSGSTPTTTRGDLIYRNATVDARRAIGTVGQRLFVVDVGGGALEPVWATPFSGQAVGSTSSPTTTSTTYVDMPEMTVTGTPFGTVLIAELTAMVAHSAAAGNVFLAFSLAGAAEVGEMIESAPVANYVSDRNNRWRFSGLTPGTSYTIKARWKVAAGTATAWATMRTLIVYEV